jgi:Tfp pilus assembly protein PilF
MRILILVLAGLVSVWSAAAHADDSQLGRAHFQTGISYYDQGRYADALKEFEEAYRLSKRVGFLYNIGVCQEKLGHDEEAATAFQGYLGSVADETERAQVQARIEALKAKRAPPPETMKSALTAPAPERKPVWKRGWFWGVLAGTAAVVAAGVAVGVVLGTAEPGLRTLPDVSLQ